MGKDSTRILLASWFLKIISKSLRDDAEVVAKLNPDLIIICDLV